MLRVNDWSEFQHYSRRNPPWIKFHKKWLDDFRFQRLPVASRALAPMLWLLASESSGDSIDYDIDTIAFRLRMTPGALREALIPLIEHGFISDDSAALAPDESDASATLAPCYSDATPETETETESESEREKKENPPKGGQKKEERDNPTFDEDIPAHLDQRPLAQQTHRSKGNGHDPPKRGCRLPEDWEPDAELIAFAESLGLDAEATADRFVDHWLAATGQTATKRDWKAAWRNWCRRAAERGETKRSTGTGTPAHQPSAAMRAWLRERGVEEGARLVSRRAGGRQAQFSAANGERIDVQADAATPREPWPERA